MMKRIHLILSDDSNMVRNVISFFHEALGECRELDFSAETLDGVLEAPMISSKHLEAICSYIEKCFAKSDAVICFLPHSSRPLRLSFSEGLNLKYSFQCICWKLGLDGVTLQQGPSSCEGYDAFIELDHSVEGLNERIVNNLHHLPKTISKFNNRNHSKTRHRYSSLTSFERLMFLVRSLLSNPELACKDPFCEGNNLDCVPISDTQVINRLVESVGLDADSEWFFFHEGELIDDLRWLRASGFIGEYPGFESFPDILLCEAPSGRQTPLRHPFAGWEEFSRLMVLIRHLIFNPGDWVKGESLNQYLAGRLSLYPGSLWTPTSEASVQHYLRVGVKPYIDNRAARKGHFLGSAVVSLGDLSELVSIVSSSAPLLNSPQTQALVQSLEQRLVSLNVSPRNAQALSSLAERSIVNPETAPQGSVRSREPDFRELSAAISRRHEIRIQTYASQDQQSSTSSGHQGDSTLVLPLQFVFHRRAWYLASEEREAGRADGPIRFLRLDRFRLLRVDPSQQKEERFSLAFSRMCRLVDRTFGLPPNKLSYQDQALVWSTNDSWMSADRTLTVCCRLDHRAWKFIREGPDRLPYPQLRMSGGRETHTTVWKPPGSLPHMDQIYCLPVHANSDHPYELQMVLPAWSVDDFDLQNWLLGFGAGLVLTGPGSFRQKLLERLQSTMTAWESPP